MIPVVDECTDQTDNCAADALCTDTQPSFDCECLDGFLGESMLKRAVTGEKL